MHDTRDDTVLPAAAYTFSGASPAPAYQHQPSPPAKGRLCSLHTSAAAARITLGVTMSLLEGMLVLVPSSSLQQQQVQQLGQDSNGSGSDGSALAAAIPWSLRQILSVEVAPIGDPADATVVLVGGGRVRAGAVREGLLAEVQDHEVRPRDRPSCAT
jgi:hypothetical protein